MRLDQQVIRRQIENLKLTHPELLEDDEAWLASLESETEATELLTSIVRRIEDSKALVAGTKERFDELKARKDRFETRIERLREFALKVMDWTAQKKIELPEATLSIRMGQPAVVGEPDADALPDHLCRIKREPNKSAIKEALQNGRTVPGCELSNGQPSIAIRIK